MKRILIAALFVATTAFAADAAEPKSQSAIDAVLTRLDACVSKNDMECVGEFFAEDATFAATFDAGKLIKGKADIVKALQGMSGEPGMKNVEQKRTVEYVRFIGDDRALVDCSVKLSGMKEPTGDGPWPMWHSTALMALKGGKWIIEDVRLYFVAPGPEPTPAPGPTTGPEGGEPAESDEAAEPEAAAEN